jgi:TonB family protein
MVAGWAAMERMRARAGIFAAPMEGVELLEGAPGSMPMAYGWFRPVIFLPAEARGWSAERFRMVIQHEMAHVKRSDGGTHVLARVALSFYWWNPLAWWAWREFLQEQERAADDFVLARGALGSQYAEHLLEIARSLRMAANGRPVVAMASRSSLENRLAAILDSQRDRSVPRRVSAMATAVVAVGLVIPLAAVRAGQEEGQVTAGDEARDQGKWKTAKLEYEKFLKKQSRGPEAAIAYIHLGTVEMQDKNFGAAVKDFEKAQSADGEHRSEALMWEALAQQYVGDMGEAARLFEAALTAADPQAAGTATEMEVYARFLDEQGQTEKAKGMRAQAAQIRKQSQTVPVSRAAPSEGVFRAGGEVSSPILLSKVEPQYSLEARMAKYSGMVRLSVVIGTDGKPRDIRVSSPLGLGLDQKAIEAVSQWRFKPGVRNGEPVNVRANIEVRFRLL